MIPTPYIFKAISYKRKLVRGLEAISNDFVVEKHYVNAEENKRAAPPAAKKLESLTKIMKMDLIDGMEATEALDNLLMDQPEPTQHSLAPSAMQEYLKNRQHYTRWLKDARKRRKVDEVVLAEVSGQFCDSWLEGRRS